MAHDHPTDPGRSFAIGVVLNVVFIVVEVAFGIMAGSLALLADAGHNLGDVLGLLLAWGAHALGRRTPTERHTYGWGNASILAALFNGLLLLLATGAIAWEAIGRFAEPHPVGGDIVLWVAGIGTAINAATAALFLRGRKADLNIRGAFLHMAADAGVSAGVAIAGLVIGFTGWLWLDPAVSLAVAAAIFVGTWGLFREAVHLSLGGVPENVDLDAVRKTLMNLPGVDAVHDLHVWALSTTETALTAHLVKPDPFGDDAVLVDANRRLREDFGIRHATLQWERGEAAAREEIPCRPKETDQ
jgi:cobalt-zinc-cadmium efflux system protein